MQPTFVRTEPWKYSCVRWLGLNSLVFTQMSFKYVYIPCDDSEPVQEVVMKTTKGEILGCLLGEAPGVALNRFF
jgi:hypothetical protein